MSHVCPLGLNACAMSHVTCASIHCLLGHGCSLDHDIREMVPLHSTNMIVSTLKTTFHLVSTCIHTNKQLAPREQAPRERVPRELCIPHWIISELMFTYFSLETRPASLRKSSMALTISSRWPTQVTPISFKWSSCSAIRFLPQVIAFCLKQS